MDYKTRGTCRVVAALFRSLLRPIDPKRPGEVFVEAEFLLEEDRRFFGTQPSHRLLVFLRALANGSVLVDALERFGQLFDDFVRRVFVHDDRVPTRLGVVVTELFKYRYVGKYTKMFIIEGRQSCEAVMLNEALRVGSVRDEYVGDAGQRIDRDFEQTRPVLHVELDSPLPAKYELKIARR